MQGADQRSKRDGRARAKEGFVGARISIAVLVISLATLGGCSQAASPARYQAVVVSRCRRWLAARICSCCASAALVSIVIAGSPVGGVPGRSGSVARHRAWCSQKAV